MSSRISSNDNPPNDAMMTKISEEIVAEAIANVVKRARYEGQSLEELVAEVLSEDAILDQIQRRWLSKIVTQAWKSLPE